MTEKTVAEKKMSEETTIEKIMLITDRGYIYLTPRDAVSLPANSIVSVLIKEGVNTTPPIEEPAKRRKRKKKTAEAEAEEPSSSPPSEGSVKRFDTTPSDS